jgi:predicted transcriptional regulator
MGGALEELVKYGLLMPRGEHGEIFEITKKGYDAAKRIDHVPVGIGH